VRNRRIGTAGLFGWNGIKATSMPRVTFTQAPPGEQTALGNTMFDNRLLRVIRTAGIEAAMLTQKRTDAELVTSQ
jgi:hypothetical protein